MISDLLPTLTLSPQRIAIAAALGLGWLLLLARSRPATAPAPPAPDAPLVLFASQSGLAQRLAQQHARRLGTQARALGSITPDALSQTREAWFLLASAGDGAAPDNAAAFLRRLNADTPTDLSGLRYGLLGLGDRRYPAFCGFARQIDGWLGASGATPLFPPVEVDRAAPADLARWHALAGDDPADQWRLTHRSLLSAPGTAQPVHQLRLRPEAPTRWTPGAIADVALVAPDGTPQQRSYSVASLPDSGEVELFLRQRHGPNGQPGLASTWLGTGLALNGRVRMTLRDTPHHGALQAAERENRPLLLIATGTGLAAVLGPLRARLAGAGTAPVWLIHGERNRAFAPLLALRDAADPRLRLDCILSRGAPPQRLPDWLARQAEALRTFVGPPEPTRQATVLVCGGRDPGQAIIAALTTSLAPGHLSRMRQSGRLLTDLY